MDLLQVLKPTLTMTALSYALALQAAQPINLDRAGFHDLNQHFFIGLPGHAQPLQLPNNILKFQSQRVDEHHIAHQRLQQYFAGFPVFGGYAIVHQDESAANQKAIHTAAKMTGRVFDALIDDLGSAPSQFKANAQAALNHFLEAYPGKAVSKPSVQAIVYIDADDKAHWAYQVTAVLTGGDSVPLMPAAILDATTYMSYLAWDEIKTSRLAVKGTGYGGNLKTGLIQHGVHTPMLAITRDEESATCYMENRQVKVIDMANAYDKANTPISFLCSNSVSNIKDAYWTGNHADGYDMVNGAYSVSNDVLYAATVIKKLYKDWYGLDVLKTPSGKPMPLVMRVHYGANYENAFWDGQQMSFGDGAASMHPLVSLDISTHEVSHGFTEQHSNLYYVGQSGGMNEAFSDMAAQAAEYFVKGSNSWQIGADIIKVGSAMPVLRYMDKPSRDGRSIDSALNYREGMDVHYSSGVFNRLFYLLSNQPGWNARKAFAVMLKANMDYWTPYTSFEQGGCGVLYAAKDMNYHLEDVRIALEGVAVKYAGCAAFA